MTEKRITAATATIDGDVGTPTVDVEITGEDRTKQLDFHFHDLRGDRGPRGYSGVYIGHEEPPEDEDVQVWIDPQGLVGKVISNYTYTPNSTPGTYAYLEFEFSDGTSLNIPIYNGADGSGIGDMTKAVYDPNNNATDIFAYVAGLVSNLSGTLAPVATSGSYSDLTDKPTIDSALSDSSTNAVQNKVVKAALDAKQDALTIDSDMSDSSTNPVQNSVIKSYVDQNAGKPFIAIYGTTTLAEITAAVTAGKEVICKIGSHENGTMIDLTASSARFGRMTYQQNYLYNVDSSNAWTTQTVMLLDPDHVDQIVADNSTNPVGNSAIKSYVDSTFSHRLYYYDHQTTYTSVANTSGALLSFSAPAVSGYTFKGVVGCFANATGLVTSAGVWEGTNSIYCNIFHSTSSSYTNVVIRFRLLYEKN